MPGVRWGGDPIRALEGQSGQGSLLRWQTKSVQIRPRPQVFVGMHNDIRPRGSLATVGVAGPDISILSFYREVVVPSMLISRLYQVYLQTSLEADVQLTDIV